MRTIVVDDYNPAWPEEFEKIKAYLWPRIGHLALDIVHVGSTSVPGLAAKPIIDFVIVLESRDALPALIAQLNALGYIHKGDQGIVGREVFKRRISDEFMAYHMYASAKEGLELERHLLFRDYLRRHDGARDAYAALKRALAERHRHDIDAYIAGKHDFVEHIIRLAREHA